MAGFQNLIRRLSCIYVVRFYVAGRLRCAVSKAELHRTTGCRNQSLAKIVATELLRTWHESLDLVGEGIINEFPVPELELRPEDRAGEYSAHVRREPHECRIAVLPTPAGPNDATFWARTRKASFTSPCTPRWAYQRCSPRQPPELSRTRKKQHVRQRKSVLHTRMVKPCRSSS